MELDRRAEAGASRTRNVTLDLLGGPEGPMQGDCGRSSPASAVGSCRRLVRAEPQKRLRRFEDAHADVRA
jgi:hypothetical protein